MGGGPHSAGRPLSSGVVLKKYENNTKRDGKKKTGVRLAGDRPFMKKGARGGCASDAGGQGSKKVL